MRPAWSPDIVTDDPIQLRASPPPGAGPGRPEWGPVRLIAAASRNPPTACTIQNRRDGEPISTATWYQWDEGRVLVNMDEARS
jgi:hypothetical protein